MPRLRSGPEGRPDGHFVQRFPPSVESLPGARHDFSRWLASCDVAHDLTGELAVAFSELTSNAVNTTVDDADDVNVRAWCEGTDLVFEVVNPTAGPNGPAQRWDREDQLRPGGRGLQIVQAFVDCIEADRDDEGRLVVRCRRSIADGS